MLSRNAPNLLLGWGTVSWLQVTHPFPNEPLTLNTWQGGSSASDFSCPHTMLGPASKPALLQAGLKPRSQNNSTSGQLHPCPLRSSDLGWDSNRNGVLMAREEPTGFCFCKGG